MTHGLDGRRLAGLWTVVGLAVLPATVRAQSLGPSSLVDVPGPVRAIGSVVAVALLGAVLVSRYGGFVDRAVEDTMDRPAIAIVYGLLAYAFVMFLTFYALDILSRIGAVGSPVAVVALIIPVGGALILSSVGYVVVGAVVLDLYGDRNPWNGLALGAGLSGVGWLVLPFLGGLAVWLLVAAVGVGGPTRTWVHGERTVASELKS